MVKRIRFKSKPIVLFGDSALRTVCTPVEVFHKGLHEKVDLMAHTLKKHGGGAALAAPQIGLLKNIIVIHYLSKYYELINPVITECNGSISDIEGCLSLPNFIGRVNRYQKIKVQYQNRFGDPFEIETENEMARCFQHEIDHLNGVLYIDRKTEEYVYNPDTNEKIAVQQLLELTNNSSGPPQTIG
ncbi:MAG TPA: peptide deformylase [Bacillota bacterium]|nr:peptide deformylase [Bacillota bacterium]